MKKYICHLLSLFLVCASFLSITIPASAAEFQDNTHSALKSVSSLSGQESGLPFSFGPDKNVTSLWTTNRNGPGGYNFVPGQCSGSNIKVSGNVVHSIAGTQIKAGICYSSGGTNHSAFAVFAPSENYFSGSTSRSKLDQGRTYYGFTVKPSSEKASKRADYPCGRKEGRFAV